MTTLQEFVLPKLMGSKIQVGGKLEIRNQAPLENPSEEVEEKEEEETVSEKPKRAYRKTEKTLKAKE